jgi:DNA-binding CsgD family transcriptional regulator
LARYGLLDFRHREIKIMNELTTIELETIMLLSKGLTAREIARERHVSYHTVNNQIANLKDKFSAKNTVNLVYIIMSLFSFEFETKGENKNE